MNSIILATEKDMERIDFGLLFNKTTNNPKKNDYRDISTRLLGGELTCLDYLKNISHSFKLTLRPWKILIY